MTTRTHFFFRGCPDTAVAVVNSSWRMVITRSFSRLLLSKLLHSHTAQRHTDSVRARAPPTTRLRGHQLHQQTVTGGCSHWRHMCNATHRARRRRTSHTPARRVSSDSADEVNSCAGVRGRGVGPGRGQRRCSGRHRRRHRIQRAGLAASASADAPHREAGCVDEACGRRRCSQACRRPRDVSPPARVLRRAPHVHRPRRAAAGVLASCAGRHDPRGQVPAAGGAPAAATVLGRRWRHRAEQVRLRRRRAPRTPAHTWSHSLWGQVQLHAGGCGRARLSLRNRRVVQCCAAVHCRVGRLALLPLQLQRLRVRSAEPVVDKGSVPVGRRGLRQDLHHGPVLQQPAVDAAATPRPLPRVHAGCAQSVRCSIESLCGLCAHWAPRRVTLLQPAIV